MCVTALNHNCRCQFPTQTYNKKTSTRFTLCEKYSNTIWTQLTRDAPNLKIIRGSGRAGTGAGWILILILLNNVKRLHENNTHTVQKLWNTNVRGSLFHNQLQNNNNNNNVI